MPSDSGCSPQRPARGPTALAHTGQGSGSRQGHCWPVTPRLRDSSVPVWPASRPALQVLLGGEARGLCGNPMQAYMWMHGDEDVGLLLPWEFASQHSYARCWHCGAAETGTFTFGYPWLHRSDLGGAYQQENGRKMVQLLDVDMSWPVSGCRDSAADHGGSGSLGRHWWCSHRWQPCWQPTPPRVGPREAPTASWGLWCLVARGKMGRSVRWREQETAASQPSAQPDGVRDREARPS